MAKPARASSKGDETFIREYLGGSILAKVKVLETLVPSLERAGCVLADSMARGGQWLIFGNGGSAADAQHLATEMTGRLHSLERRGLPALALTTDSSALTSIGNDYGFETVFSRQVEALGRKGDVALGITTSGNSPNVLRGLRAAKRLGMATLAFSGKGGGAVAKKGAADLCLTVPTDFTPHVQECHGAMGHILCFLVERELGRRGHFKRAKHG
ncbi:MAG TPA: D-sedoheptulose 7-phosphate isomerase [bacterium]|jgi:D-sedoheptulose 7-phosphate isomerase|nr:D-sedoheptulose 7-phosphate isomerase [bacterium]